MTVSTDFDRHVDRILTEVTAVFVPAGLPGGPTEDTSVGITPADVVAGCQMVLSAHADGVPIGEQAVTNARRILARARTMGLV